MHSLCACLLSLSCVFALCSFVARDSARWVAGLLALSFTSRVRSHSADMSLAKLLQCTSVPPVPVVAGASL